MLSTCVWERKNRSEQVRPSRAESTKPTTARKTPLLATRSARSRSPAPSARPIRALTPTAVPVARPIIRFCAGNASDTAVSACSLTRLTNQLSTMLYSACTSMDAMMGRDIFQISFVMGMTPSLFSFSIRTPLLITWMQLNILSRPGKKRNPRICVKRTYPGVKTCEKRGKYFVWRRNYRVWKKARTSSAVQAALPWAKPSRPPPRP